MQKYTAKNLTNRTLQMHLPGGRYVRLAPGCSCNLNHSDCRLPMVKKMMRKNALIIPSFTPPEATKGPTEKIRDKSDENKTSAETQTPAKDQPPVEAGLETAAGVEAGTESGTEQPIESAAASAGAEAATESGAEPLPESATAPADAVSATEAVDEQLADQGKELEPSQKVRPPRKKLSIKKASSGKNKS